MQVSIEATEGLERRVTVELPAERVEQELEKRLRDYARNAKLDGFRPGKAPMNVIRMRFGKQAREDVVSSLAQSSWSEVLQKNDLTPAGHPRFEILPRTDGSLAYEARLEVMPEITLADLSGITIKRPVSSVTDQDLDRMIDKLREQRATWNKVEREASLGDRVRINFKGLMDGEPIEKGSAEDHPLVLGSNTLLEGFESGLIGASAGDTRSLNLQFPETYPAANLAGKPAVFEVEVLAVEEKALPEVDEEFAKAFGVASGNVDELRTEVRTNMERELEQRAFAQVKERVWDAMLSANSIDAPKVMVHDEAEGLRRAALSQMQGARKMEIPLSEFEPRAERRVKLGLLIGEVVAKNGIHLDQSRVRERIERHAQSYEDPQEVIEYYYSNRGHLASVENVVIEDQIVEWALGQFKVEDEPVGFDAVMQPQP